MPSSINFQIQDYSGEKSTVSIPVTPVTAVNFDTVLGNLATQGRNELEAAIDGVSAGTISKVAAVAYDIPLSSDIPPDPWAQREAGLRVYGRGASSQKLYTLTIPAPNFAVLADQGSDVVRLDRSTEVEELVTALEDNWKGYTNPATGTTEAIVVEKMMLVGRNN